MIHNHKQQDVWLSQTQNWAKEARYALSDSFHTRYKNRRNKQRKFEVKAVAVITDGVVTWRRHRRVLVTFRFSIWALVMRLCSAGGNSLSGPLMCLFLCVVCLKEIIPFLYVSKTQLDNLLGNKILKGIRICHPKVCRLGIRMSLGWKQLRGNRHKGSSLPSPHLPKGRVYISLC